MWLRFYKCLPIHPVCPTVKVNRWDGHNSLHIGKAQQRVVISPEIPELSPISIAILRINGLYEE